MMASSNQTLSPETVFYAAGVFFVTVGGLVAAATSPLGLHKGSWLAAYLVLVCGMALATIGRAQAAFAQRRVPMLVWRSQFLSWVVGNALVIAGSLNANPQPAVIGGILLMATIGLSAWILGDGALRSCGGFAYVILLLLLAASIPIGLTLAYLRGA